MSESALQQARICRGCWDQMHVPIPIRGPLAVPFRIFGVTQSKMNPNICTICERAFARVKKGRQIALAASILFADIRGYTALSERLEPLRLSRLVSVFQDQSARAVWAHDGIVNKQMGDGLMAIFNFPILIERHAEAAIRAAIELQGRCKAALAALASEWGLPAGEAPGVGAGVHTGEVAIGEFSSGHSEFTAIGGAVNLAARLAAQAAAGEILVSAASAALAPSLVAGAPQRTLVLKGIEHPVPAQVLTAG
jgi:adenylate cyclase